MRRHRAATNTRSLRSGCRSALPAQRGHGLHGPVSLHSGRHRQVGGERLDGVLGLQFLENENTAFKMITATIAAASAGLPLTAAKPAATIRSSARGWVNWASSSPGHRRPPRRVSSFGPSMVSRRVASRPVNPWAELASSPNTTSRFAEGSSARPRTAAWTVSVLTDAGPNTAAGERCVLDAATRCKQCALRRS